MSKKIKRKDPMKGLIVLTVLLALLAAGTVVGGRMLSEYRAGLLAAQQEEVEERNARKQAEYNLALQEYQAEVAANQANKSWPEAAREGWDVIDLTNYPLEAPGTETVSRSDIMFGGLLLVNEWHSRPGDFDESGILSLSSYARESGLDSFWADASRKLHTVAIDALIEALKAAKEAGQEHYVVDYSYRTWDRQNEIFQEQVEYYRRRYPNYSDERLIERAKTKVNYPGTSEFNSGLAFSLYLYESGNEELRSTPFYETAQGKWFYENSWKYGFVFRFPTVGYPYADTVDKTYKTGMSQSLNCYRYVGKGHAAVMNHLGLCLEEYVEYLQEHPHIAVFENGVKKYEITRQQVGDDVATFTVDVNRMTNNYTMSLDNMGGVVTVYEY
ncbi:MAG: D-alanyl-D-alanine carboxypeptidase family protein [Clostridia bacterium]|nr:D-alanyl-D-alanine carboxypeptidase family protein [Clostridia bacterium]